MPDSIYDTKVWTDKFIYANPPDIYDEKRVAKIVGAIPSDAGTVLDVGIGGGYIYREIKKNKDVKAFGIDISWDLVRRSNDNRICVGDIRALPFKDASFDLVLAADLIEHIKEENFNDSISEIIRTSKKYILLNMPYKDVINWPVSVCNVCNKEFNIYGHERTMDIEFIENLFKDTPFGVIKSEIFGKKRDIRPSFLIHIARRWGKIYSREGTICPRCFNTPIIYPERKILEKFCSKAMALMFFLMDRLTPPQIKGLGEMYILLKKR